MSDKAQIYAAFVKAQKEFAPALKTSVNPAYKSRYADLAACVDAVLDALNNHGIGLMQHTHPDERGITVETVFIHESGESILAGKLHVPASKQDPQGYGSALSYARRYSLMAACGIAPEDDDGNAASGRKAKTVEIDLTPWFMMMDNAKSADELKAATEAAWAATQDDRITAKFNEIVAAKKAAAKKTKQPTEETAQ